MADNNTTSITYVYNPSGLLDVAQERYEEILIEEIKRFTGATSVTIEARDGCADPYGYRDEDVEGEPSYGLSQAFTCAAAEAWDRACGE